MRRQISEAALRVLQTGKYSLWSFTLNGCDIFYCPIASSEELQWMVQNYTGGMVDAVRNGWNPVEAALRYKENTAVENDPKRWHQKYSLPLGQYDQGRVIWGELLTILLARSV